jgi:tetratricopeptide (TPR) repeat protein
MPLDPTAIADGGTKYPPKRGVGARRSGRATGRLPPPPGMRYGSPMPTKEELYDQAIDFFADGALDQAVAAYQAAIAIDPDYVDAWHGLAMAYNDLKQYDQAIEAGKKLCELTPDDVLAHTSLSRFYQAAGKVPEAEAEGAKARMLDWKRQLTEAKEQKSE